MDSAEPKTGLAPKDLTEEELDSLNERLSQRLNDTGYAAMFTTVLRGKTCLRLCAIHPETTKEDIVTTMDILNRFAQEEYASLKQQ